MLPRGEANCGVHGITRQKREFGSALKNIRTKYRNNKYRKPEQRER
jgi:hypothetical protein